MGEIATNPVLTVLPVNLDKTCDMCAYGLKAHYTRCSGPLIDCWVPKGCIATDDEQPEKSENGQK